VERGTDDLLVLSSSFKLLQTHNNKFHSIPEQREIMKTMQHQIHDLVVFVGFAICYMIVTATITHCTNIGVAHDHNAVDKDIIDEHSFANSRHSTGRNIRLRRAQINCKIPKVSLRLLICFLRLGADALCITLTISSINCNEVH
jgi:hypothetical protein